MNKPQFPWLRAARISHKPIYSYIDVESEVIYRRPMVRGGSYLKLLGAALALKAFCRERRDLVYHLRMDRSTVIAYINHLEVCYWWR